MKKIRLFTCLNILLLVTACSSEKDAVIRNDKNDVIESSQTEQSSEKIIEDQTVNSTEEIKDNKNFTYIWDEDVKNGLLYSSESGYIVDKEGNVISEYNNIQVLKNGIIMKDGVAYDGYFSGTGGKIYCLYEDSETDSAISEIDKIINKNMEEEYPITPWLVVQLFTDIQKCYYNVQCTENELLLLAYKATELFAPELIEANPFSTYFSSLNEEINEYKKQNKTITNIIISDSSDVRYSTIEGTQYAQLECTYYFKSNQCATKVKETYVLMKDNNDRWKILGWKEYEESEW